jgi:hypothetical protein
MSPERWRQIQHVLDGALDRSRDAQRRSSLIAAAATVTCTIGSCDW